MNAFLDSLREDLLDRRLRPILALLVVAMLGALAYAMLGGSGSSSPTASSSAPAPTPAKAVVLSAAKPEDAQAVAETTVGASSQTGGPTRNPFTPLVQPKATSTTSTSNAASASSSSSSVTSATLAAPTGESGSKASSGSETGASTPGAAAPTAPKTPPAPAKPRTTYDVSVSFGAVAPATPLLAAKLTPYPKLSLQQPLPSVKQPLIVFRGVIAGGKSAAFTLVSETILRGTAACRPSASQCQVIDLQKGQTEELEYVPLGGAPETFMLHIVDIKSTTASASAASTAHAARVGESQAGLKLLHSTGLQAIPGMRYSRTKGVLVFAARSAAVARAAVAAVRVLDAAPQALSAST